MDLLKTPRAQLALYFLLPFALSVAGALSRSWMLILLAAGAVYLLTAILPICSGRESIWVFLTGFLTCLPADLRLLWDLMHADFTQGITRTRFDGALWLILCWLVLISLESLLLAIVSRLIWSEQDDDAYLLERLEDGGD